MSQEETVAQGRVARVVGPVVDVEFPPDSIPPLYNALKVDVNLTGQGEGESSFTMTLEVAQHLGGEEIYNIFEVLNARGQKLKQIELLKNHIMKYVQPRDVEFIDQAKVKWRNIQNNIEHLSDPDVIIQHFAKCYIEKNAENKNSSWLDNTSGPGIPTGTCP